MSDLFVEPADATPLNLEERQGLIPTWVTTRADLNIAEEDNIVKGLGWARRRKAALQQIVSEDFSKALHEAMFSDVWDWAGTYRRSNKNLGKDWWDVPVACAATFADFRYWIEQGTFPADELAVRFHHLLVSIHPFPNGNGRHSRLMADLLIERLGRKPFTWGGTHLADETALRRTYIGALHKAGAADIRPLLAFARA